MKWFIPKSSVRAARAATGKPGRSLLFLAIFSGALLALAVSLLAPKTSYAGTDYSANKLLHIGDHCHDLHEITHDFNLQDDTDSRCHDGNGGNGWQEVVHDELGCSDSMFYQHDFQTDPQDRSVVNTLWFTKQGDYKDCYNKALAMVNAMTDPSGDCFITKEGSDNYKKCQGYQDKLHAALGCNGDMFQSIGDSKWKIKPEAAANCKGRVDQVGDVHVVIIGPDGKSTPNSDAVKSASVQATDPNDNGNGGDSDTLACDFSGSPLSWLICPVVNLMTFAIQKTDGIITDQMSIPTGTIFCNAQSGVDDSCQSYYSAWSTFRNMALGLLVIVGLIIVISQAVGMEILDAYTIRKTLPRLLVAAVAITLSWPLMNFAVTLSNNLGYGIRDLILAPFHNLSASIHIDFFDGSLFNKLLGTGAVAAALPVWIAFGGIGSVLSYVATAGLAVLIAILVLIIRQIVIIMLILLSPLALLAYVLPNTQRAFRFWWEAFSRALLMFPLIAALIATGRVVATISLQSGGVVNGIIGFVAYFGPYFLIPLTFQFSGSIMGGVGNFIQQRTQGAQQALSGYRSGQRESRVKRARAAGLYRPGFKPRIPFTQKKIPVGNALNRLGWYTLNPDEMIPYGLGTTRLGKLLPGGKRGIPGTRRGGNKLESEIKRAGRDQTVQAVQDLDIGYKSGRLMGGRFGWYRRTLSEDSGKALDAEFGIGTDPETGKVNAWRAPENWGERMRVAELFEKAEGPKGLEAREAGNELRAVAGEFEKYTSSPETNRVDGRLLGLVSAAKAGRLDIEDVVDNQHQLMKAGDQENAVRETTILQDALTAKRVSSARGHAISYDEEGYAHNVYDNPVSDKAQSSLMRINSQEIAGSKSEDVDTLRDTLIAGASQYEMNWNFEKKRLEPVIDPKTGGPKLKDPNSKAGMLVKEARNRIKQIAMYSSGDPDVGRKIRDIWVNQLRLPESELEWGKGTGDARDREIAFGPQAQPPGGEQQGGGQGPQQP
jgi:hypothetical protein